MLMLLVQACLMPDTLLAIYMLIASQEECTKGEWESVVVIWYKGRLVWLLWVA